MSNFIIENGVLVKCNRIRGDVDIPEGVTAIGDMVFFGCSSLKSVNIPNGVTEIGDGAFFGCSSLKSVNIPESVRIIGDQAFFGCLSLTCVNIPVGVEMIGMSAFSCRSSRSHLNEISVDPKNSYYSSVDGILYTKCRTELVACPGNKESVDIPEGVETICHHSFLGCSSLTSVNIPDSVTTIGEYAFSGCGSLKKVEIPDNVVLISNVAFCDCASLESVTIPDSVEYIGDAAFVFTSLSQVYYRGTEEQWSRIRIGTNLRLRNASIYYNCKHRSGDFYYSVDDNIGATIALYVGTGENVLIPDCLDGYKVSSIGCGAFENCSSLESVTIPESVEEIGADAFRNCISLVRVIVADSVKSVGSGAFFNTSLYNSEPNWKDDALYIGNHFIRLKVDFRGSFTVKSGTKTVAGDAFSGCCSLKSVTIPNSIVSIGKFAFSDCTSLESANVPIGIIPQFIKAAEGCPIAEKFKNDPVIGTILEDRQ